MEGYNFRPTENPMHANHFSGTPRSKNNHPVEKRKKKSNFGPKTHKTKKNFLYHV